MGLKSFSVPLELLQKKSTIVSYLVTILNNYYNTVLLMCIQRPLFTQGLVIFHSTQGFQKGLGAR